MRALVFACVFLSGCNAILGIEKGDLAPDAGASDSAASDSTFEDAATDSNSAEDSTTTEDSTTPGDTGSVSDVTPEVDTGVSSFDVLFPDTGDTVVFGGGFDGYMCTLDDDIKGERVTPLPTITKLKGSFELVSNDLETTCPAMPSGKPTIKIQVRVNTTLIGTFSIDAGSGTSIPVDFTFPAITGPNYTIEYKEITQVPSGCGCTHFEYGKSTLKLSR